MKLVVCMFCYKTLDPDDGSDVTHFCEAENRTINFHHEPEAVMKTAPLQKTTQGGE